MTTSAAAAAKGRQQQKSSKAIADSVEGSVDPIVSKSMKVRGYVMNEIYPFSTDYSICLLPLSVVDWCIISFQPIPSTASVKLKDDIYTTPKKTRSRQPLAKEKAWNWTIS